MGDPAGQRPARQADGSSGRDGRAAQRPAPCSRLRRPHGVEVSWAGAASGPGIGGCTWFNGTSPLGGCPVPVPAPTGFVFDAAIVYVGWTVDGNLTGSGLAAPPGANGLTFTT